MKKPVNKIDALIVQQGSTIIYIGVDYFNNHVICASTCHSIECTSEITWSYLIIAGVFNFTSPVINPMSILNGNRRAK